jgi:hypothetical protein
MRLARLLGFPNGPLLLHRDSAIHGAVFKGMIISPRWGVLVDVPSRYAPDEQPTCSMKGRIDRDAMAQQTGWSSLACATRVLLRAQLRARRDRVWPDQNPRSGAGRLRRCDDLPSARRPRPSYRTMAFLTRTYLV